MICVSEIMRKYMLGLVVILRGWDIFMCWEYIGIIKIYVEF